MKKLYLKTRLLMIPAFLLGLLVLVGSVPVIASTSTIEVSQLTYLTTNNEYDRNPSILYDGSKYWLFYTKGDDVSTNGVRGGTYDPDSDSYVVYYKTASEITDLDSASQTKLSLSESARPTDFDQRVASATYFGGKIYVFVSSGQSGTDRGLYYYEYSGGSWNGPTTLIDNSTARGGHVSVTSDSNRIYIVWESSDGSADCYTWNGTTLSTKIDISADNMPKITLMGATLYVVGIKDGSGDINVYSASTASSPSYSFHSTAIAGSGLYDPAIFNDGTDLYIVSAPYDSGDDQQNLIQSRYNSGSWSSPRSITFGGYGGSFWWEYWPIGFYDGSDLFVFYTTETNSPTFSDGEIAYFKMDWNLDYDHFVYIQNAIDQADPGATINIAPGTYDEPINIENVSGITLNGANKDTVIIKSSTVLPFNVGGYGSNRTALFRVVNSTGVVLQNMTLDLDLVKGSLVHGILYWDSTGTVHNNVIKNLSIPDGSPGGYLEIGSDFRAPGYSNSTRAPITISDNTFIDTGRIGVVTHDFVDATITGNTFYKTTDDFGYAIEIGGPSTGEITGNTIYGYDTPAASDGSESAGIYIENAYTDDYVGTYSKPVLVQENEIYDCQYGFWIGNGYNSYAGDVDIEVTLLDNEIHDNVDAGLWIEDEDKENGSSVTVTGSGNEIVDNGDYGLHIYTNGDGDITVSLTEETITGHDTAVFVEDAASPSDSVYDIAITQSDLSGNTSYGVDNDLSGLTVDTSANWWGSNTAAGVSDEVNGSVDYTPWLDVGTDLPGDPGFQGDFSTLWVDDNSPQTGSTGRIQEGVDLVSGSTVNVLAGTYLEQIVIDENLTLAGAGSGTIIQSPDTLTEKFVTSVNNFPIIYIHDANDVTVKDMVVDGLGKGNANYRFIGVGYRNAGGTVDTVKITNIRDTPFSGAQHGVALYAYNDDDVSRSISVQDCVIHDFQKNAMALNASGTTPLAVDLQGNVVTGYGSTTTTAQNGIQVWADLGTGTVAGNTLSGIAYDGSGWVATTILNYYADINITGNTMLNGHVGIYNIDGAGQLNTNDFTVTKAGGLGYGIIATDPPAAVPSPFDIDLIKDSSRKYVTRAPLNLEISNNTLAFSGGDNTATYGISANAGYGPNDIDVSADNNIISDFEVGIEFWTCTSDCDTGVFTGADANYNALSGNTYGIYTNLTTPEVDGQFNWWGDATGPSGVGPGSGDAVAADIDYSPWLGLTPGTTPMTWYTNDSIQEAVDVAGDDDTIMVLPGTYNETVTFASPDGLTITGDSSSKPVVNGGIKFQNSTPIDGITFENLYLIGDAGSNRIIRFANSAAVNDFSMDNCVIDGENVTGRNAFPGNLLGQSFSITDTEFKNLLGFAVMDIDSSSDYIPWGGNGLEFTTVTFAGNTIHDCNGSIALRGHYIDKTTTVNVYGNTWDNIGGNNGETGQQWAALEINHAMNANVYDNTVNDVIEGLGSEGQAFQFWDIDTLDMHDNTISNNFQGIYIFAGSSGGSFGGPYAVPGGAIYDNCFDNNSQYALSVDPNATGGPLDAEENWWGDATGPYHATANPSGAGDEVGDNVDFIPWTDACGGDTTANFQNTTTGEYYATLQAALDDANPGETILAIGAGTVPGGATCTTGNVTINLNGRTLGPGSPALTVSAANVLVIGPGVLDGSGSADPAILVTSGGDNFTLKDVEVTDWADGVEIEAGVTTFQLIDNYIHDNTGAGLQ
ncbi:MAG: right-handed parallel beta-helix repeat-containing protein, partial [Anaerolineales bacterium]|nr:right-handed parallel beta-helix repeat-containing protein [Anaerolineales bacterium]